MTDLIQIFEKRGKDYVFVKYLSKKAWCNNESMGRDWQFVKATTDEFGYIQLKCKRFAIPRELIGKRVRIKLEIID